MQKISLYLVTGNVKKSEEFKQILGEQFDIKTQNIDLPEFQGDSEMIAKQKVKIAYESTHKAVIVQDTALCFNAYKGLPGPYIKWFLKAIGPEGLAKMVDPFDDKTGYAMCSIAYMTPQLKQPMLFVGKTLGKIVQPKGSRQFGWDPCFLPDGYDKTYGEMQKQIKNKISHRFKAIQQMRQYFQSLKTEHKQHKQQKQHIQHKQHKQQKQHIQHKQHKQQKQHKQEMEQQKPVVKEQKQKKTRAANKQKSAKKK